MQHDQVPQSNLRLELTGEYDQIWIISRLSQTHTAHRKGEGTVFWWKALWTPIRFTMAATVLYAEPSYPFLFSTASLAKIWQMIFFKFFLTTQSVPWIRGWMDVRMMLVWYDYSPKAHAKMFFEFLAVLRIFLGKLQRPLPNFNAADICILR